MHIVVFITTKNSAQAKKISRQLVKEKLIACANIHTIESIFEWKGSNEEGNEWVLLLKTVEENYSDVVDRIKEMHSYDVPCILKIPVMANAEFEGWVKKQCKEQ